MVKYCSDHDSVLCGCSHWALPPEKAFVVARGKAVEIAPEWLDIIWKGRMAQINGKGKIRYARNSKDGSSNRRRTARNRRRVSGMGTSD